MLTDIKSAYTLKCIFSFIESKIQLKLIIHNKQLQSMLDININSYKNISHKCLVIGKKNLGKEIDIKTNKILFKGQYLNGKRHGNGIEYNLKGKKIYDGNYNNGERSGKGKEYGEINNKLIYEGEFRKNKRHGMGKEYRVGILIFEGKYLNGKMWEGSGFDAKGDIIFKIVNGAGHVKEYHENGKLKFEGEYLKGLREGKAKEYFPNGKIFFEGNYKKGKKNGIGIIYDEYSKKIFEGDFLDDKKNGKGKEFSTFESFEGEYKNDKRHGKGKEYYCGKLKSEAEYSNGKKCGKIKEYDYGKIIFEGECADDKYNGYGKQYKDDKIIFSGEYKDGERWKGEGKMDKDDDCFHFKFFKYDFIGTYSEGKKNGKIKEYAGDSVIYDGEILNDLKHGKGKEYDTYHHLIYEGEYENGKYWTGKFFGKNGTVLYELEGGNGVGIQFSGKNTMSDFKKFKSYEGGLLNGERNGFGKEYSPFVENKLIFEGEFLNGKRNGKGKEYEDEERDILIIDDYNNDERWRENGSEYKKLIFEGDYLDGERTGKGKEYDYNDKFIFEGEYKYGKRNGKGKEYKDDKIIMEGEYKDGKIWNGKGIIYDKYKKEIIFEGDIMNGKKWKGKGKEFKEVEFLKIEVVFDGEYLNGKKWNGKGKEYKKGKIIFDGIYKNGKRWEGKGEEYDENNKLIFKGSYKNGKKVKNK